MIMKPKRRMRSISIITAFILMIIPGITVSSSLEGSDVASDTFLGSLKFEDFVSDGSFQENLGQWKNDAAFVSEQPFGHMAFNDRGIIIDMKGIKKMILYRPFIMKWVRTYLT